MHGYRYKRFLDIGLSIGVMIGALPFFCLALLLTFLDGHENPIFTQERLGLNCKIFTIYKFKTMRPAPMSSGPQHIKQNAPELTRIGRFLRNTSMDELPQLINVLKGDMSLVGPRPHAIEFARYYASLDPRYYQRYAIRPGLVGLVQVTPLRYLTDTQEHIKARVDSDLFYVGHSSFGLDMTVLYKAIFYVLAPVLNLMRAEAKPAAGPTAPAVRPKVTPSL